MSVIGSRTFAAGVANYLTLQSEELVRQFGVKSGYLSVRVGFLHAINGTGNISFTTDGIGACQSGSPLSSTLGKKHGTSATLWGGHVWSTSGAATLTYNAGPPAYYSIVFTDVQVLSNGFTGGAGGGAVNYVAVAGSGCRSFAFIDFVSSGGNWAISEFLPTTVAQAQTDWMPIDIMLGCQQVGNTGKVWLRGNQISNINGSLVSKSSLVTGAWFDTISKAWNLPANIMEIYGYWAYSRFTTW